MTDAELKERNRAKQARWRALNRERALELGRASHKKWHDSHRAESIAAMKLFHSAHREEILARRRDKWSKLREPYRARQRERYAANKEANQLRAALRRASEAYRERARQKSAEWRLANPDRLCDQAQKQRALKRRVFVECVNRRIVFKRDKGRCGICRKRVDPTSKWEIDHIIPISRGGAHCYDNVQLAHGKCNRAKRAKMPKGQPTLFQVVA
jgi:5-methylcytosine-specific restriction endonuclease McrA